MNVPPWSEDSVMALLVNVSQVPVALALKRGVWYFVKRVPGGLLYFPHSLIYRARRGKRRRTTRCGCYDYDKLAVGGTTTDWQKKQFWGIWK